MPDQLLEMGIQRSNGASDEIFATSILHESQPQLVSWWRKLQLPALAALGAHEAPLSPCVLEPNYYSLF